MTKLRISGGGISVTAQFNPTEYSRSKGVNITEQDTKGLDAAVLQFIRGNNEKLNLTLLFDATIPGSAVDVVAETDKLCQLAMIKSGTEAIPETTVTWGSALSFTAYVDSVERKYTLFEKDGTPLRATVTLSFREFKTEEQLQAQKRGQTSPHTTRWVIRRGDTLCNIAAEVYRDAGRWRDIADANPGLSDPRRLSTGKVLIIPPRRGQGLS